jgi:hypothetical protein
LYQKLVSGPSVVTHMSFEFISCDYSGRSCMYSAATKETPELCSDPEMRNKTSDVHRVPVHQVCTVCTQCAQSAQSLIGFIFCILHFLIVCIVSIVIVCIVFVCIVIV